MEESEIAYEAEYHRRMQREAEERIVQQHLVFERCNSRRSGIVLEEQQKRTLMEARLRPEQEAIHDRAKKILRLQQLRNQKIAILEKERTRELLRIQQQEAKAQKDEVKMWFSYIGADGVQEDLDHFAQETNLSPQQSREQIQRFCHSKVPSAIVSGQSPVGPVSSYKDFASKWRTKYQEDKEDAIIWQEEQVIRAGGRTPGGKNPQTPVQQNPDHFYPFREAPSEEKLNAAVERAVKEARNDISWEKSTSPPPADMKSSSPVSQSPFPTSHQPSSGSPFRRRNDVFSATPGYTPSFAIYQKPATTGSHQRHNVEPHSVGRQHPSPSTPMRVPNSARGYETPTHPRQTTEEPTPKRQWAAGPLSSFSRK